MDMKFLQALTQVRQGIENNNMTQVAAGYEAMTGESVKPKKARRGRKPKVDIVAAPGEPSDSGLVPIVEDVVDTFEDPAPVIEQPNQAPTNVYGKTLVNKFDPNEYASATQRGEERIQDNQVAPVPRRRPPAPPKPEEEEIPEIGITKG